MPQFLVFYNGARCGASAPDHAHLQAGARGIVPIEKDWRHYENKLQKIYPTQAADEAALAEQGYNARTCGIFQLKDYVCPAFVVMGEKADGDCALTRKLIEALPVEEGRAEPDMNVLVWRQKGTGAEAEERLITLVFPRSKHRPDAYFEKGEGHLLISPGALDMGGLIITPREEDFNALTPRRAADVLAEVALSESEAAKVVRRLATAAKSRAERPQTLTLKQIVAAGEPNVSVGIMAEETLNFTLHGAFSAKGTEAEGEQSVRCQDGAILWNGNLYSELAFLPAAPDAAFTLHGVTIGLKFHWQRKESHTFRGALRLIVDEEKIRAINVIPVEEYLKSVISSEMKATASLEFLKAHAIVSRSWLFRQMEMRQQNAGDKGFFSFVRKDDLYLRWYDSEDHTLFDVCADDHCQRYQGITRPATPAVEEAVEATRGQVLFSDDRICDARFGKCCGGVSERFSTCWDDTDYAYLQPVRDAANAEPLPDLMREDEAEKWIRSAPPAYCNTSDEALLQEVLNDFDLETRDFYRWSVDIEQKHLQEILKEKAGIDFGEILDLVPVERGASGRLQKLKIVGTAQTLTVGKELEIRRWLSDSHLLSSAFVVEKRDVRVGVPQTFRLYGAGWGHGVGMCQIGAAAMSRQGRSAAEILGHYYKESTIKRLYE